ncbi:SDR family oxidoreductase [Nocardia sp. XZ_19_369]|uniref:SDR family oxidoreductase n=1 Tax=Nocardia sp. XZ_19_369 TaxID=2769487 RepID=UPI00188F1D9D|nr:SDR family oxidoreductase [Nocardia sp. XZ_19_369]
MNGEFTGKIAVVTGGGKGVGRRISRRLAEQGAHVLVNYFHSENDARATVDDILGAGGSAELLRGSVADADSVRAMFGKIADHHGGLDILINNAARGTLAPLGTLRDNDWTKAFAVNLDGSRRCAQAAAALMAGRDGSIVNLSSIGAGLVIGNYATVGVSKAALEALTRYLAVEFAPDGIRVNTASAGLIDNATGDLFPDSAEFQRTVLAATPLRRLATETDLTEIVLFLASDRAAFITGQVILADGGLSLGSASLSPPAVPAQSAAAARLADPPEDVAVSSPPTDDPAPEPSGSDDQLVAVVGTGLGIAGASSPQEFWRLLTQPVSVFNEPGDRFAIENFHASDPAAVDRTYCRVGGHLHDFRPHPDLAAEEANGGPILDEATRWLRHSLLQAKDGVHLTETDRCAVYIGAWPGGSHTLAEHVVTEVLAEAAGEQTALRELLSRRYPRARAGAPVLPTMVVRDAIAGLVDSVTEAMVIDTACASSLYTVDFGVKALLAGDCDVAYCGGFEALNPTVAVMFAKLGGLSHRGEVRAFDATADGTLFSDGAAVVTLKLLSRARADGDEILGVLTGFGAAADGRGKAIAAPNPAGQRLAIQRARDINDTAPEDVDWIVAHATGTTAGDRAELRTLADLAPPDGYPCSSNKAVVGHTGWAAGAVSLIHATEALREGRIPGQFGFTSAPDDVQQDRTRISAEDSEFRADPQRPRTVGISAFGFGGTNGHLLLTDRPSSGTVRSARPARTGDLAVVAWSAHLPGNPDRARIRDWLRGNGAAPQRCFSVPYPAPTPAEIRLTPKTIATIDRCHLMAIQVADTFLRDHGELWDDVREATGVITAHTGVPVALADAFTRTYADDVLSAVAKSDAAEGLSPLVESVLSAVRERVPPCNEDTYAGVMTNVIASRITSRHNLRGMSVAVDAGDDSAMAALSTARRYLQTGDLKLALLLALNGNSGNQLADILGRPPERLSEGAFLIALATAEEARRRGWPIAALLRFDRAEPGSSPAAREHGVAQDDRPEHRDYLGAAGAVDLLRAVEGSAGAAEMFLPNGDRVHVATDAPGPASSQTERLTSRYVPTLAAAPLDGPVALHSTIPAGSLVLVDSAESARLVRDELAGADATILAADVDDPADDRVQAIIDRANPVLTVICGRGATVEPRPDSDHTAQLRLHDLTFLAAQRLWPRWTDESALTVLLPDQPATGLPHPYAALFTGLVKSLAWERPGAPICAVLTDAPQAAAMQLLALERRAAAPGSVVWHLDGVRLHEVLTPEPVSAAGPELPLTDDSVLLVTGGTGGLPVAILRALSEQVKPTVWLLARTDPTRTPEYVPAADGAAPAELRAELIRQLRETEPDMPIRSLVQRADRQLKSVARHRAFEELAEKLGARHLHYRHCDVLDRGSVRAAVDHVLATEGRVDLVIHAAGLSEPALLTNKSFDSFRNIRDTKVIGYQNVKAALAEHPPARWCNIGSVAGAIGLPGDTDYSAANDFLAACARRSDDHEFTLAFPLWWQTGLRADHVDRAYLRRQGQLSAITTQEGTQLFLDELGSGTGCAVFLGDNERDMLRAGRPHNLAEDRDPNDQFLGEPVELTETTGCWHYRFDRVRDGYLTDHVVDRKATVPGTLMLEIAARAAMALRPDAIVLGYRDTRFEAFIKPFAGRRSTELHITATVGETGKKPGPSVFVELSSEVAAANGKAPGPRRRYFRTEVLLSVGESAPAPHRSDAAELLGRAVRDPYCQPESPVHIGGFFDNITQARVADQRSTAAWSLPPDRPGFLEHMRTPWLLLDAMLRTFALAAATNGAQPILVPRAIGRIDLSQGRVNDVGLDSRYGTGVQLFGDLNGAAALRAIAPDGSILAEMADLTMHHMGTVRLDPAPSIRVGHPSAP